MSIRSDLEDAIRNWLVMSGAQGGITTPAAKVVFADQDAPRPAMPYLLIRLNAYDVMVGEDQHFVTDDTIPLWVPQGQRTGSVSINAFGATAEAWLERAKLMLHAPSVLAASITDGITIRPVGGMNNLSYLLDDHTQVRFQHDFAVDYQRDASATEVEAVIELAEVDMEDTFASDSPPDRVINVVEVI